MFVTLSQYQPVRRKLVGKILGVVSLVIIGNKARLEACQAKSLNKFSAYLCLIIVGESVGNHLFYFGVKSIPPQVSELPAK